MTFHIQLKVQTVIDRLGTKKGQREMKALFDTDVDTIRKQLVKYLLSGREIVPVTGCDTTDPTGKCHGHPAKPTKEEKAS